LYFSGWWAAFLLENHFLKYFINVIDSGLVLWKKAGNHKSLSPFFNVLKNFSFCIMSQLVDEYSEQNLERRFLVIFFKHETKWSNQKQAKNLLILLLMAEPVFVAINLDDFWFGMKG